MRSTRSSRPSRPPIGSRTPCPPSRELLAQQLELPLLTQAALHDILASLGAQAGAFLVEGDGERLVAASHGFQRPADLLTNGHVERAARTLAEQFVALPDDLVVEGLLADFRPREALAIPIAYKGAALGVIVVASIERLQPRGAPVGCAVPARPGPGPQQLAGARPPATPRRADSLTGAYNRRFGLERLR